MCEIEHYVAQRYLALGYEVVATTELPSGDIMDWISAESVPGSDQPPPPPISPDEYHPRPGAQLGKTELQMHPELRGPVDTIGFHRPTFPAYVNGETEESSLEEILQRPEQPGEVPPGTDRLYAGYALERYNHGATTIVNAFGGAIDAYTFSLLEMAVWCNGPDPTTTREHIGIAASRDNINFYHTDSATRVQVEFTAAGDTIHNYQGGWHGSKLLDPGFIPVPQSSAHPGDRLAESVVGGTQFEHLFKIVLWEGNWWVGYNLDWMGYYPFYLFDEIVGYACWMAYYGEVYTLYPKSSPSSAWTTTDMGSGEFGDTGYYGNAAYFRQMSYFDTANVAHFMFKTDALPITSQQYKYCYTASVLIEGPEGDYVYYCGGPGNDAAKADMCQ